MLLAFFSSLPEVCMQLREKFSPEKSVHVFFYSKKSRLCMVKKDNCIQEGLINSYVYSEQFMTDECCSFWLNSNRLFNVHLCFLFFFYCIF